jgi:hypothetical protein
MKGNPGPLSIYVKGLTVACHLEGWSVNPDCPFDVVTGLWIFHERYPFLYIILVLYHTLDFMYVNQCLSHMGHGILLIAFKF